MPISLIKSLELQAGAYKRLKRKALCGRQRPIPASRAGHRVGNAAAAIGVHGVRTDRRIDD
jgi:hypothetical protein